MTKRIVSLSLDIETIELAKSKLSNVSAFVESFLKVELGLIDVKKEDQLAQLKNLNAKLTMELSESLTKIESLTKQVNLNKSKKKGENKDYVIY